MPDLHAAVPRDAGPDIAVTDAQNRKSSGACGMTTGAGEDSARRFLASGARAARPGLFGTVQLSGVSVFATVPMRFPAIASAARLIACDGARDTRRRHATMQPDFPSPLGLER